MILLPPQMYREFQLGIAIAKKMRMKMSHVPRNLFGAPERKESVQLLQETLDQERTRFSKRWNVDPLAEDDDKENGSRGCNQKLTPKKRSSPYHPKQTTIHDYWRSRKVYEGNGKNSPGAPGETSPAKSPPQMQSLSLSPSRPQQTLVLQETISEPQAQAQSTPEPQPDPQQQQKQQQTDTQPDDLQPPTN